MNASSPSIRTAVLREPYWLMFAMETAGSAMPDGKTPVPLPELLDCLDRRDHGHR
jgi:hypothetical protein